MSRLEVVDGGGSTFMTQREEELAKEIERLKQVLAKEVGVVPAVVKNGTVFPSLVVLKPDGTLHLYAKLYPEIYDSHSEIKAVRVTILDSKGSSTCGVDQQWPFTPKT